MKKILALALTGLLLACGSTAMTATAENDGVSNSTLYLVPGTYVSGGEKIENTVSSGAEKLTDEQCGKIFTDNVYLCTLPAGEALPVPTSARTDKEGNAYTFNGWWAIVDATVTYFDTVPESSEISFLYADWRADLSQRKDPVEPEEGVTVQSKFYLSITHAGGETETVALSISGTESTAAYQFGYGAPVQLYNEWFELKKGDKITVYTTGLGDSEEPQESPINVEGGKGLEITLEYSNTENNDTADYLSVVKGSTVMSYTSEATKHYRIYLKFYDDGAVMTVYMQPME